MNKNNLIKKLHILLFVSMIMMQSIILSTSVQAKELDLYARSALLMDASNGRVLYEENGYKVMPMASTTKIMTCILALEYMERNQTTVMENPVVVSSRAASMPKVHLGMKTGEEYQLNDLLYSLMLESHNDTAVAIAEYIGGSVEEFSNMMNLKAKELGCNETYFITPNGLDAEKDGKLHSTTAYELGLIAAYAIKNDKFLKIIKTRSYSFTELKYGRKFNVNNKDRFLDLMEGAIGIKTGFTGNAGYCFVGALTQNNKTFISVVLGCGWPPNKSWKWADTKKLMSYGLDNYEYQNIKKEYSYKPIPVKEGIRDNLSVYSERGIDREDFNILLSNKDKIEVKVEIPDVLNAPILENQTIGYEKYFINGNLYKTLTVKASETVELRTYFYCLWKIFMLYF